MGTLLDTDLECLLDVVLTWEKNGFRIWSASVVLKFTCSMFNVWAHSCTFVPKKIWQASLLRIMSVDVQLFSSTQALKEHWTWQRKRGLESPELLCSALPVNAPQWASLQKTKAYQGRLRGCVQEKAHTKTASKASIGEPWQRIQPDESISDRKGKWRRARKGEDELADHILRVWLGMNVGRSITQAERKK